MVARRRNIGEDLAWLKWWLILLVICLSIAVGGYWVSLYYRAEMRQLEFGGLSNFQVILQEVEQIAESERIIVENIDRFNALVANRFLDEEDRVSLLEDVGRIRDRFRLFPIDVEIREQTSRMLDYAEGIEFPEEFISIHSSEVLVRLPCCMRKTLHAFLAPSLVLGG